jgi:RNA polymerase sigma-70 factor (ECF subfamily)
MHDSTVERLIHRARSGDNAALGDLLQTHRAYLKLLARRRLGGRLAGRIDESDAVQQTCLSALRNFGQFRGQSAGEFVVWLRTTHELNLKNVVRNHLAAKRAAGRDRPLEDAVSPVEDGDSPTQRVLLGEQAVLLALAIDNLPESQAEAVRLRYLEGLSLATIAVRIGRTEQAVVGLLKRALDGLRARLDCGGG